LRKSLTDSISYPLNVGPRELLPSGTTLFRIPVQLGRIHKIILSSTWNGGSMYPHLWLAGFYFLFHIIINVLHRQNR